MIVAGFGFRAGASLASLHAAWALAQDGQPQATLLAAPVDRLSSLAPLGQLLGLPLAGVAPAALAGVLTPTQSTASHKARGTGSVAEASALAAAGPGAVMIANRHISPDRMATCAIAKGTAS